MDEPCHYLFIQAWRGCRWGRKLLLAEQPFRVWQLIRRFTRCIYRAPVRREFSRSLRARQDGIIYFTLRMEHKRKRNDGGSISRVWENVVVDLAQLFTHPPAVFVNAKTIAEENCFVGSPLFFSFVAASLRKFVAKVRPAPLEVPI